MILLTLLSLLADVDDSPVDVSLSASASNATVFVDDADSPIPLPATITRVPGPMHLRIVVEGYRPYDVTVDVIGGAPFSHHAELDRLSETERKSRDSTRTLNILKSTMFWAGTGLVTLGALFVLLPSPDSPAQNSLYRRFQQARSRSEADRLYAELSQNAATARTAQTVGWVMFGVGAAAIATWAVVFWLTPEPRPKSRILSTQLGVGPGSLFVFGSF